MKRWQSLTLGLVISVISLYIAVNGVDLTKLGDAFAHARWIYAIPALICLFCALVCRGLRWQALVDRRTSALHAFHITNVGYLFSTLLPFRLGELARIYLATQLRPPIPAFTALSTILTERLTDILGVFVIAAIAISVSPVPQSIATAAAISGGIAVIGLIVVAVLSRRRQTVRATIEAIGQRVPLLKRINPAGIADRVLEGIAPIARPRSLVIVLGWTAAAWTLTVFLDYFVMAIFYDPPTIKGSLLMIASGALAVALPATPGSIGPFEAFTREGLILAGSANPGSAASLAVALACAVSIHALDSLGYAVLGSIGLFEEHTGLGRLIKAAQTVMVRTPSIAPAPVQRIYPGDRVQGADVILVPPDPPVPDLIPIVTPTDPNS